MHQHQQKLGYAVDGAASGASSYQTCGASICSVNIHVLLEVLLTIQEADFQYFIDLEALINMFFTQAKIYLQNTV